MRALFYALPPTSCSVAILLQELVDSAERKPAPGNHPLLEPSVSSKGMDSQFVGQSIIAEAQLDLEFPQLDDPIILHIR